MAAGPPFFSVVIPAFNRARYVAEAIRSALAQTCRDFELIVVDDGSTDNTRDVLRPFKKEAKLLFQPNSGVSAARNRGAAEAAGRWLAFLDSDDRWLPDYLAAQRRGIVEGAPVTMQCADCRLQRADGQETTYFQLNGALAKMRGASELRLVRSCAFIAEHSPWQIGSTVVDAAAFRRTGGFDTSLSISEDFDLMFRVALLGPARFIRRADVEILRRVEPSDSLSLAADRQPLRKRLDHDAIYVKLMSLPGLDRRERAMLRRLRSANRRGVGNLFLALGDHAAARRAFWEAFQLSPSTRSLGRLVMSLYRGRAALHR